MAMSSADEQNQHRSAANRMVYDARERLQAVRNQFWRERVQGEPSPKVRRELAIAALQLYDVLYEHREEEVVESDWNESAATRLQSLLNSTVEVPRDSPGRSSNAKTVERPAIMAIGADELLQMTKELDDLAKTLGFSANTADGTTRTEITDEMIEEVEKWRKANL